jgi:hypothetical protein
MFSLRWSTAAWKPTRSYRQEKETNVMVVDPSSGFQGHALARTATMLRHSR